MRHICSKRWNSCNRCWLIRTSLKPWRQTGIKPLIPGNSFYLQIGRFPLYVPFNWLWRCRILNGERNWLQKITAGTFPFCVDLDNPSSDSIRNRLVKDKALYKKGTSSIMFVDQVIEDLNNLMSVAVSQLEITSDDSSCVSQVLTDVQAFLLKDWNSEWYKWSVQDFINSNTIQTRDLDFEVGMHEHEFPYLRFSALTYTTLTDPFRNTSTNDEDCKDMTLIGWQAISSLFFGDDYWKYQDFFDHLKPFTLSFNAILLFVERNMRLMPSFAGHDFNIVKDHPGSMRMERASEGEFNAQVTNKDSLLLLLLLLPPRSRN